MVYSPFVMSTTSGVEAVQPNPFIAFAAEDERLAVLKEYGVFSLRLFFCIGKKGFVVEYVAVLVDFNEGGAFVLKRLLDYRAQMVWIPVQRARHERRT